MAIAPPAADGPNAQPFGLSVTQAAALLGVSVGTVRRWADDGALQSRRTPGGQRRFSASDLERFAERQRA